MKEIEVTCKLGKELSVDEIQTAAVKALGVSPKMKSQIKYRILRRSIDARNDIIYRYRVEYLKDEETRNQLVKEHEEIYRDIKARDAEKAREISFHHVENQRKAIIKSIKEENKGRRWS